MTALKDLLVKVEAGTVGQWFNWNSGIKGHGTNARLAYNSSLDAAKALHGAVLPGWKWGRQWSCHMWVEPDDMPGRSERYYGNVSDPARAWLIAVLRALIAQEGEA